MKIAQKISHNLIKDPEESGFIDYRFNKSNEILMTKWNNNKSVFAATNYSSGLPAVRVKCFFHKSKK